MPLAADVLLPLPVPAFTYLLPFGSGPGPVGGRVVVPWQGTLRIGICIGLREVGAGESLDLRELISWLDDRSFFTPGAVELFSELAQGTAHPPGSILAALSLTGLDDPLEHEFRLQRPTELAADLAAGQWLPAVSIEHDRLERLRQEGLVLERARVAVTQASQLVATAEDDSSLGESRAVANQRAAFAALLRAPAESAAALARTAGVPVSSVRALISKGLAEYRNVPAAPPELSLPEATGVLPAPSLELPASGPFIVTGGVRLQRLAELLPLLEEEINSGLSPLLLAPELVYLEEAVAALRERLPVIMLSGELDDRQRQHAWKLASARPGQLLAGTFPALLMNPPETGSIVVLESASSSWKGLSGPRLFIPETARLLARIEGRRLIETEVSLNAELSASGTPVLSLPPRSQRIHVTDMNSASGWPIDSDLSRVLRQVQERERQAVVLSSRRGFSGALACNACGHTIGCLNCDLPLRYHQKENELRCHQCNHTLAVPLECPSCGSDELQPGRSAGTQWLASSIRRLLPGFRVVRYDTDVREHPTALLAGESGVLVATTAALRLPSLPNVSLLAVSLFDAHLSQSDFRAAENTLRLMLQLPELSSRPRPLVVIQTFQPEHPVLDVLRAEDQAAALERFTDATLERREAFGYPPFAHLARIEITARDSATAEVAAQRLQGSLLGEGAGADELLGPVPAGVARIRGRYVWQLLLRCRDPQRFRALLAAVPSGQQGARFRIDVNPRDVSLDLE